MRPKPYAFIAVLFLLSGLAFAINYADYYYTSESDVTVTTEDFTLDGTAYSLVSFDGDPTFLLRGGEIVSESSTISQVIHDYYAQNYYPSEEDLNELKALVERYNESRNDGYDWKDKEETACRGVLFTDKRIEVYIEGKMEKLWCHDEASCDINAKLLYQAYHEVVPVNETGETFFGDIVGPVCESGDFLAQDRDLPMVAQDDLLAVCSAGAYGFVMASNYNSRPRAAEGMVCGEQSALVRARETWEDLVRGEDIPDWK